MNISKISIIDSNNFYSLGIKYVLQSLESCKGSDISIFSTGAEYLSSNQNSELVLLNMMLPDIGGIKLCHLIKTKSPKTTPKSNVIAALKPLVILVSISTKNTGPMVKAKRIPHGIAAKISLSI